MPPHSHTLTLSVRFYFRNGGGEGGGSTREGIGATNGGQKFTRGVENTNMTDCISSLYKHLGFCVSIVPSSMGTRIYEGAIGQQTIDVISL